MIQGVDAADMTSAYEEAKGDLYIALNDFDAAHTAYEKALQSDQSGDTRVASILRLKLGQSKPYVKPEINTAEQQVDESQEAAE